ncbi:D-2-hydroxyacid dehydrogenase [Paraburkholderia oxyphila]|uniref:D-2-hydroxyacid dehydrogenase n=1 Tax=Paraburkholderia oxyphila TaxID=614212 RepID=UPI000487EF64|nr:D-2-hydroxyacid dehydrogenase [Paraburkholderia oxyphila]
MSTPHKTSRIVFLDRESLSPQTKLKPIPFAHELTIFPRTEPEQVGERIADAEIVITNKTKLAKAALERASRLKLVAVAATGTDNVDLPACRERGIAVSNIRGYAVNTVPEHTFALIFALRRSIVAYRESVRAGRWEESAQFCFFDHPIRDLANSTLGIIGDGVLGQAVASMGRALNMQVRFASHKGKHDMGRPYVPFDEVMRTSDIITLHCPLLPETHNMIDWAEFQQMERKPLIINTARGGLVNEEALVRALSEGLISGAGFDVTTQEPPTPAHPFHTLRDTHNFILTPHVAWASEEAMQALADQLVENIVAFHAGSPRNLV